MTFALLQEISRLPLLCCLLAISAGIKVGSASFLREKSALWRPSPSSSPPHDLSVQDYQDQYQEYFSHSVSSYVQAQQGVNTEASISRTQPPVLSSPPAPRPQQMTIPIRASAPYMVSSPPPSPPISLHMPERRVTRGRSNLERPLGPAVSNLQAGEGSSRSPSSRATQNANYRFSHQRGTDYYNSIMSHESKNQVFEILKRHREFFRVHNNRAIADFTVNSWAAEIMTQELENDLLSTDTSVRESAMRYILREKELREAANRQTAQQIRYREAANRQTARHARRN